MVSPGLFRLGSIDLDFSSSLPISLIRPGFSGCGGGGSICCGGGPCGTGCWAGDCTPSEGCGAPCGQPASERERQHRQRKARGRERRPE